MPHAAVFTQLPPVCATKRNVSQRTSLCLFLVCLVPTFWVVVLNVIPAADCGSRPRDPSTSAKMPPRISGHDLMAIFPTNPPSHTVSCDDLFKKQARQFLSTPEPPLRSPREPTNGAPGHHALRGEAVAPGHDTPRAANDPNLRLHPQQYAVPSQQNGKGHSRSGSSSSSRPHTGSRPSTGQQQGAMPVIYQYEACPLHHYHQKDADMRSPHL